MPFEMWSAIFSVISSKNPRGWILQKIIRVAEGIPVNILDNYFVKSSVMLLEFFAGIFFGNVLNNSFRSFSETFVGISTTPLNIPRIFEFFKEIYSKMFFFLDSRGSSFRNSIAKSFENSLGNAFRFSFEDFFLALSL